MSVISKHKLSQLQTAFWEELIKMELSPAEKRNVAAIFSQVIEKEFEIKDFLLEECDPEEIGF